MPTTIMGSAMASLAVSAGIGLQIAVRGHKFRLVVEEDDELAVGIRLEKTLDRRWPSVLVQ